MLQSLYDKIAVRKVCNFVKKRLQHRCFSKNIAKFLRTPFLQNTSDGCFCYFKKFVNFLGKHQWRKLNKFIFLINTTNKILLKLADILHFYITWVIWRLKPAETKASHFPCFEIKQEMRCIFTIAVRQIIHAWVCNMKCILNIDVQ